MSGVAEFETRGPLAVLVDVGGASLRVRAADVDRATVEVRPHDPARSGDAGLAERVTSELAGTRLVVRTPRTARSRLRSLIGGGERVDVDVVVPTGSSLEVRGWGEVSTEGALGDVEIDSGMGDVDLDEVGRLRVKVAMGDVRVRVTGGPAEVRTSAGEVRVGTARDELVAKTSAGDVVVERGEGELRLSTAAGDVRVDHATTSVTARTSAGDVRLHRVTSGVVTLESAYGRLEVGVADGTAAWLDVEARHGTVRSDLAASDGPGDAELTVELHVTAGYGDVVLRRA